MSDSDFHIEEVENQEKIEETIMDFENYAPSFSDVQPDFSEKACYTKPTIPPEVERNDKKNIIPEWQEFGNKLYCREYEEEELETTVNRFPTHEPYDEHDSANGDTRFFSSFEFLPPKS